MSIMSLQFRTITRSQSRSVVAAAAYRSATRLHDDARGRDADFTGKEDVAYSALLLPPGAERFNLDRGAFWNAVDRRETRKDARLAFDVVAGLPAQLDHEDHVAVARAFAEDVFVRRGLGADLNIHEPPPVEGRRNPHAHIMATTRAISAEGSGDDLVAALGAKHVIWVRELRAMRAALAEHVNERLEARRIDRRLDPLSFRRQGLALEPRFRLSISSRQRLDAGRPTSAGSRLTALSTRNGDRIIADPEVALSALGREQTVFTEEDLVRFLSRHAEDPRQLDAARARVLGAPATVDLGRDDKGRRWFAARDEVAREARLLAVGRALVSTGRLTLHVGVAVEVADAIAAARGPHRPTVVLMSADERRRERLAGAEALGASAAEAAVAEGRLNGCRLVISGADTGRTRTLEPFIAAAEERDLMIHLVGAPSAESGRGSLGAVFRTLVSEARQEAGREAGTRTDDRTQGGAATTERFRTVGPDALQAEGRAFARIRGLGEGLDGPSDGEGLSRRRRREAEIALQRRRAVLEARTARSADALCDEASLLRAARGLEILGEGSPAVGRGLER